MRRTQSIAMLAGLLSTVVTLVVAPAASAQTGYPPGLCTAVTGSQDVGSVNVGQRFVLQVAPTCLFTPGTPVTVTVNGVDIPGKVAEPGGFVLVDITVVSTTQLSIDDPVLTPAVCGPNTVTAQGASATAEGGISTQTATFTLNCSEGTATDVTGGNRQGLLSRTGAELALFAATAFTLVVAGSLTLVMTRRRRALR